MTEPLLTVEDLKIHHLPRRRGDEPVRAIDGVSLHLGRGETLGLLGESGSGKSTLGNAILGLVPPTNGRIYFDGSDITRASSRQRRALGRNIQVVFQDPYTSLNPSRTIGSTLTEPLRIVHRYRRSQAVARAVRVLQDVGLPADAMQRYPAEFSGGQRQRIAIARAIAIEPQLIVCDEPTSALDLSVQAQVLNLLLHLQRQRGLSYLFISHDIDVVRHMSHRVAVLLRGLIVESGPTQQVTGQPTHEYTQALLRAAPRPEPLAGPIRYDVSARAEAEIDARAAHAEPNFSTNGLLRYDW